MTNVSRKIELSTDRAHKAGGDAHAVKPDLRDPKNKKSQGLEHTRAGTGELATTRGRVEQQGTTLQIEKKVTVLRGREIITNQIDDLPSSGGETPDSQRFKENSDRKPAAGGGGGGGGNGGDNDRNTGSGDEGNERALRRAYIRNNNSDIPTKYDYLAQGEHQIPGERLIQIDAFIDGLPTLEKQEQFVFKLKALDAEGQSILLASDRPLIPTIVALQTLSINDTIFIGQGATIFAQRIREGQVPDEAQTAFAAVSTNLQCKLLAQFGESEGTGMQPSLYEGLTKLSAMKESILTNLENTDPFVVVTKIKALGELTDHDRVSFNRLPDHIISDAFGKIIRSGDPATTSSFLERLSSLNPQWTPERLTVWSEQPQEFRESLLNKIPTRQTDLFMQYLDHLHTLKTEHPRLAPFVNLFGGQAQMKLMDEHLSHGYSNGINRLLNDLRRISGLDQE